MATGAAWYGRGVEYAASDNLDWEGDDIRVALLLRAHDPNQNAHQFFSEVNGDEASGTGYTAGGQLLTGKSVGYDAANRRTTFDGGTTEWLESSISAGYAVIYKDTGTASTSPLLGLVDFGEEKTSADAAFRINWSGDGILRATANAL